MSFLKKTWLARIGVGLNRFRMNNSTDVVLESNPISVTQAGDQLSADNMNNLETRIDNAFTEMAGNLATIEVSPSQHNWTVGSQIVYNGILYKVTSAISTNDNLVVGTNIEPYPVSSALSDIIASGTGYIKYFDGTLICYGRMEMEVSINVGIGSMYRGTFSPNIQFPISFIENPAISLTPASNEDFSFFLTYAVLRDKTGIYRINALRPTSTSNSVISFSWIAIGRWK